MTEKNFYKYKIEKLFINCLFSPNIMSMFSLIFVHKIIPMRSLVSFHYYFCKKKLLNPFIFVILLLLWQKILHKFCIWHALSHCIKNSLNNIDAHSKTRDHLWSIFEFDMERIFARCIFVCRAKLFCTQNKK